MIAKFLLIFLGDTPSFSNTKENVQNKILEEDV